VGIKFNFFTGEFDIAGAAGGSGGLADRYISAFNATTDWGAPSSGEYSITISSATHGKGVYPNVSLFENITGVYHAVSANDMQVDASGNITIKVLETPDTRFAGLIVVI
jgi:hypothetical protein